MVAIRLATFNVYGLPFRLAPLARRAPHFCERFDGSDIDVVTFQEVWSLRALAVLRAHLPSFPFVGWRRGVAGRPAGGLVTFSRRPVRAVSYTAFRGVRPTAGGALFRVTRAVTSRLKGVLIVELDGLVVATTHLSANHDGDWSADNRHHGYQRAQLSMLLAVLRDVPSAGPKVLTGDFNVAADGPLYPMIAGAWRDPFAGTASATFHAELLPPGAVGRRIDYLLVSGDEARFPVTGTDLLFTEPLTLPDGQRLYLSDHVALTATVGLPEAAGA